MDIGKIATLTLLLAVVRNAPVVQSEEPLAEPDRKFYVVEEDEIPLDFSEKLFRPFVDSLERAAQKKLSVRQNVVLLVGDEAPCVRDSRAFSVIRTQDPAEYFSRLTSRVDVPTQEEIEKAAEVNLLTLALRDSRLSQEERRNMSDRRRKLTSRFPIKPGAAFLHHDNVFWLRSLDNSEAAAAGKRYAIATTDYVPYRRAPLLFASTIALPASMQEIGLPPLMTEKPNKVLMHYDGSVTAFWRDDRSILSVHIDSQTSDLPTEFSVRFRKLSDKPFALTRVTWEKDDEGRNLVSTVDAQYGHTHKSIPASERMSFHATLNYDWSDLSAREMERYLSQETFQIEMVSVPGEIDAKSPSAINVNSRK